MSNSVQLGNNHIETFGTYLNESLECFKQVCNMAKQLNHTQETFCEEIRFLKSTYRTRSTEDEKQQDKKTFGTKIKEFFLKIWGFFVRIFKAIGDIVVNLIKSIIIFVSKKRLQMNSIFKMFEKDGGLRGFNLKNGNVFEKTFTKEIKTIAKGDTKDAYNHETIYQYLTTKHLQNFINTKIQYNNRNSPSNIENIKAMFKAIRENQLYPGQKEKDSLMNTLMQAKTVVDSIYASAIISNEIVPPGGTISPGAIAQKAVQEIFAGKDLATKGELFIEGKVDSIANYLVFGQEKKTMDNIQLSIYFGTKDIGPKLEDNFKEYYELSNIVLGKNGYIEKIENTLKEYKKWAKEDHKSIVEMNNVIIKEINSYVDDESPEAKSKLWAYRNITDIVSRVRRIKSHFIRLRQQVLINIMTMYSIENKAWWVLSGRGKNFKDHINEGDEIKDDTITLMAM